MADKFSYICMNCGCDEKEALEFNQDVNGYWCECCEYFNGIDSNQKYMLILEDKNFGESINVKKNKSLKKQLSPLRYPGGKSKMIDYLYSKINLDKTEIFVEVFAGGSSFGLSLLEAEVIDRLIINDLDYGIYSLFKIIKENPEELISRIENAELNHLDFFRARKIVKDKYIGLNNLEAAWNFLIVNRLAYSGIYKANPLGGKAGSNKDLLQRWNPTGLIARIRKIHAMRERFDVLNMNAIDVIENYYWYDNGTLFIDPPYVVKGEDLYNHFYLERDHRELAEVIESLTFVAKAADVLITYDNDELIGRIYDFPEVEKVKRAYSV